MKPQQASQFIGFLESSSANPLFSFSQLVVLCFLIILIAAGLSLH